MRETRKNQENNQGFSLIELVIVIVIMAVLVGIVGMQVIPYIAKANKAKDKQKISSYCTDAMTAFTSCAAKLDNAETYTITVVKNGSGWTVDAKDSGGTVNTVLRNEFLEMNHLDTKAPDFLSKEAKQIDKITLVCRDARPTVSLTVTGPENPEEFAVEAK